MNYFSSRKCSDEILGNVVIEFAKLATAGFDHIHSGVPSDSGVSSASHCSFNTQASQPTQNLKGVCLPPNRYGTCVAARCSSDERHTDHHPQSTQTVHDNKVT